MKKEILQRIRSNPYIYSYLREDSTLYKEILKDEKYLDKIEEYAKIKYKQTPIDKIERVKEKLDLIKTFLDVLE